MTTLTELLADLDAEYADLRSLVAPFRPDAPEWDLATPAEGWAIRDQISHLAYFDDAGRLAMVEPDVFAEAAEAAQRVMAEGGDPMAEHLVRGRLLDGDQLLAWWDRAHTGMMAAFAVADPKARVPWFGPPMGALSFISARLMETWAHGQDIADALGQPRVPTDRLRHVAHLGVKARPFSYLVHGRDVPAGRVDVVLEAPSGGDWRWQVGDSDDIGPTGTVEGPALDFCWVVTQRRNLADTSLTVDGAIAEDWMSVAQAFAGPPGSGRPPRTT
ncbi:MAG: TIGR03084 family metal-binding protein [Acidimicrobiales bacterium]